MEGLAWEDHEKPYKSTMVPVDSIVNRNMKVGVVGIVQQLVEEWIDDGQKGRENYPVILGNLEDPLRALSYPQCRLMLACLPLDKRIDVCASCGRRLQARLGHDWQRVERYDERRRQSEALTLHISSISAAKALSYQYLRFMTPQHISLERLLNVPFRSGTEPHHFCIWFDRIFRATIQPLPLSTMI